MGAIQSSINQALGTAAAGVAAAGRTNELIKSNKLSESQNETAKAQFIDYVKAQNEIAQLEAEKEFSEAKDAYNRNTHQYLADATLNLTDEDVDKKITGEEAVNKYLNKLADERSKEEGKAFREYNDANLAYQWAGGDGITPEDKLKLAIAGNNKKEAKQLENARSRLNMAKKASLALDEEITARNNLKFNIQIAKKKIAALQLDKKAIDKKATELKAKENK